MTTWSGSLPNSALDTARERWPAIVKTVAGLVTAVHSQYLRRLSRHEVSSTVAASAGGRTETASSLYGASKTYDDRRSNLETLSAEIDSPNTSPGLSNVPISIDF